VHSEYRYLYLNKSYLSFNRGEDFLEINQSELPVAAMSNLYRGPSIKIFSSVKRKITLA
jgi:hypothetical protein